MKIETDVKPTEQYLGDGVYTSWDGEWYVTLDLRGQPTYNLRDDKNRIAMEPEVLKRLLKFLEGVPS